MRKFFLFFFLAVFGISSSHAATQQKATRILIEKSARRMTLFSGDQVLQTYRVALGSAPVGPKTQEGDERTPEGDYKIDLKNQNSHYHLSLRISYPNAKDRAQARARHDSPGGDIMIHGLPNGTKDVSRGTVIQDWTEGCVAVTNSEIEEIWKLVDLGTPVKILP
jgi:murein L,D-transpeptidase YafK